MRHALLAIALLLAAAPARSEEAAPKPAVPAEKPPVIDLSRSVTLTGYELQAIVRAQVAAAQAQAAAQAAAPAVDKVNAALAVPAEPPR